MKNTTAIKLLGRDVILPDGEIAIVTKILGDGECEVRQPFKIFGCGPWIFRIDQLTVMARTWGEIEIT